MEKVKLFRQLHGCMENEHGVAKNQLKESFNLLRLS